VLGAAGVRAVRGFHLSSWDPAFEIVAGDEVGGGRRYAGEVADARICAGVPPVCAEPGAGPEERARLAALALQTQTVSVSARVLSRSDGQDGPARIVGFSGGVGARNLMLGQVGSALVARIRTPITGANGSDFELLLPDAVRAGEPTVVAAEYERGALRLTAEGAWGRRGVTYRFGLLDGWLTGFLRADTREFAWLTPEHLWRGRAAAAVVLLVPLLLALVGLAPRRRARG
jgi:hypothetical protein